LRTAIDKRFNKRPSTHASTVSHINTSFLATGYQVTFFIVLFFNSIIKTIGKWKQFRHYPFLKFYGLQYIHMVLHSNSFVQVSSKRWLSDMKCEWWSGDSMVQ